MTDPEKRQVLEMLDAGKINADQALTLIHALGEEDETAEEINRMDLQETAPANLDVVDLVPGEPVGDAQGSPKLESELEDQMSKARSLWWYGAVLGVILTVAGAFGLYSAVRNSGIGFWFFLASLPFFIGVLIIALAIANRGKRWLYVDVQPNQADSPKRIVISVPISLVTWGMSFVGALTPAVGNGVLQPILEVLENPGQDADPVLVHVNGNSGEKVTVFIA